MQYVSTFKLSRDTVAGGVKKLPDNFLVANLSEIVARQKPSKFPFCDICKLVSHRHKEASSKCLDCAKLLCTACVTMHRETKVTSGHSIFDVEIEKDIECKEHQDEVCKTIYIYYYGYNMVATVKIRGVECQFL